MAAAPPASAQLKAQVVPVRCALAGRPSEVLEREVLIENRSEMPVVVQLALSDWTLGAQGDLHLFPAGSSPRSLAGLVAAEPSEFSLPPLGSRAVQLRVTVPADGPASRWGVVLSRFQLATADPSALGSVAVAEVGTTIYLSRNDAEPARPEIVGMSAEPAGGDSLGVRIRLRNAGGRPVHYRTELSLQGGGGAEPRLTIPSTVLLPDGERDLSWTFAAPLCPGGCLAVCSIDTGEPTLLVGEIPITWPAPGTTQPLATGPAR
jgi:hypothetical protein